MKFIQIFVGGKMRTSKEQTKSEKLRRAEKIFGERWGIRRIISRQSVSAFPKATLGIYDHHKYLMPFIYLCITV